VTTRNSCIESLLEQKLLYIMVTCRSCKELYNHMYISTSEGNIWELFSGTVCYQSNQHIVYSFHKLVICLKYLDLLKIFKGYYNMGFTQIIVILNLSRCNIYFSTRLFLSPNLVYFTIILLFNLC